MKITPTGIEGLFVVSPFVFSDARGDFVKPFNRAQFVELGLAARFDETFYSVSKKNVLRGFHLQLPPHESAKLVWVSDGAILDVLLDLRSESATYGQCFSVTLSSANFEAVYIPNGVAHAFYVLGESATVIYQVGKCFAPSADSGIKWDSAGFDWPCPAPLVSDKDNQLAELGHFASPF
jgi:dTDP-4-dehydrorhamnose 3,5-epimerase